MQISRSKRGHVLGFDFGLDLDVFLSLHRQIRLDLGLGLDFLRRSEVVFIIVVNIDRVLVDALLALVGRQLGASSLLAASATRLGRPRLHGLGRADCIVPRSRTGTDIPLELRQMLAARRQPLILTLPKTWISQKELWCSGSEWGRGRIEVLRQTSEKSLIGLIGPAPRQDGRHRWCGVVGLGELGLRGGDGR